MLAAIYKARRINAISGGVVIAPWEVEQLPEAWLDAFAGLDLRLPRMRQVNGEIEAHKAKIRANNPSYKSHV